MVHLLLLKRKNTVLNGIGNDQTLDEYRPRLSKTMDTIKCLVLNGLTPSKVQGHDT